MTVQSDLEKFVQFTVLTLRKNEYSAIDALGYALPLIMKMPLDSEERTIAEQLVIGLTRIQSDQPLYTHSVSIMTIHMYIQIAKSLIGLERLAYIAPVLNHTRRGLELTSRLHWTARFFENIKTLSSTESFHELIHNAWSPNISGVKHVFSDISDIFATMNAIIRTQHYNPDAVALLNNLVKVIHSKSPDWAVETMFSNMVFTQDMISMESE